MAVTSWFPAPATLTEGGVKVILINYKLFGTHSQIISNSRACQQHRLVALKGEGSLRVSRSLKIGRSRCHNQGLGRSHASCDGEGASSGPSLNRVDGTAMDGSRDAAKHDQNRSSLHGVWLDGNYRESIGCRSINIAKRRNYEVSGAAIVFAYQGSGVVVVHSGDTRILIGRSSTVIEIPISQVDLFWWTRAIPHDLSVTVW